MTTTANPITIAVLGGTGAEGSGLAFRWAHAGHRVILGSRSPQKASDMAHKLNQLLGREAIVWETNMNAAQAADVVVLTVPHAAQRATVEEVAAALRGKVLVDATVPLVPPKVNRVRLPAEGSAVAAVQALLGPTVKVVSAFQNVSAHHLKDLDHAIDCDVLVCGDDIEARERVIGLSQDIGLRGVHAGPICNSAAAEALTSILISINMAYKVPGAGLRITGVSALEQA
jgi:NADPH-dependent F420 reductase